MTRKHIDICDYGTIVILSPVSDDCKQWFSNNVGEPEDGESYICDHRMAQDILEDCAEYIFGSSNVES